MTTRLDARMLPSMEVTTTAATRAIRNAFVSLVALLALTAFTPHAVAQSGAYPNATVTSVTTGSDGHVASYVVKDSGGTDHTILVNSPNDAKDDDIFHAFEWCTAGHHVDAESTVSGSDKVPTTVSHTNRRPLLLRRLATRDRQRRFARPKAAWGLPRPFYVGARRNISRRPASLPQPYDENRLQASDVRPSLQLGNPEPPDYPILPANPPTHRRRGGRRTGMVAICIDSGTRPGPDA